MIIGSAHPGLHLDVYAAAILAEHLFETRAYSLEEAIHVSAVAHALTPQLVEELWQLMQTGTVRKRA